MITSPFSSADRSTVPRQAFNFLDLRHFLPPVTSTLHRGIHLKLGEALDIRQCQGLNMLWFRV